MESSGPPHCPPGDRFSCPPFAPDHSRGGGGDPRVNWGPTPVPPSGGISWATVPSLSCPRRHHHLPSDPRPSSPAENSTTSSTSTVVVRPVAQRLRRVVSRSKNSAVIRNGNQMNNASSTVGAAELSKACGGPASFDCRDRWIQIIQGTTSQEDCYFLCTLCGTHIQGQDAVTLVYPSGTTSGNTGCWSNDDIESHLCSNLHRRNVQEHFGRAMGVLKTRDYAATLDHRIDSLQDPNKRMKLYARIGRAVVKDQERFTKISLQIELTRFERMEAIYCLELAVWKTVCCLEPRKKVESIMAFQQWMKEGWKQNKASRWRCNQVNIIMNNVVPFLKRWIQSCD